MESEREITLEKASGELTRTCPNCGQATEFAFACRACRHIDEARAPQDFFDLLGVTASFDVDSADLRRRYLALSRMVHPDACGDNADAAVRISAKLNEAYDTLCQPIRRATYLLERTGAPESEADRSVPPEVLMDAMSLREKIQQANTVNDRAMLSALADELAAKSEERSEQMARCARQFDAEDEASRSRLRQAINALSYYDKMMDSLWSAHGRQGNDQDR